jgi:hypothetical protein
MLVQLPETWDQEVEFHGLTLYAVDEEDFIDIKSMRFVDCEVFSWAFDKGPLGSMLQRWVMERCNVHSYVPQIDKLIDYMAWIDCVFDETSFLLWSSSSVNIGVVDNCLMPSGMSGTPKNLEVRNTRMGSGLIIGPAYGGTERILLENSIVPFIVSSRQQGAPFLIRDRATGALISGVSFANGTITVADTTNGWQKPSNGVDSGNPFPWAVPGAKVVIYGADEVFSSGTALTVGNVPSEFLDIMVAFTVLDVYVDGSGNYCVDTDLIALPTATVSFTATVSGTTMAVSAISTGSGAACLLQGMVITGGGLPANTTITHDLGTPNNTAGVGNYTISSSAAIGSPTTFTATTPMFFLAHPCPRMTVRNCTGGKFVADQVGAPCDIPLLSYSKRKYHGLAMTSNFPQNKVDIIGNLVSWTINVTKPYIPNTGTPAFALIIYMGGWAKAGSNLYYTYIKQSIDLKTAGVRTIGPTAGTTSTPLGADSFTPVPFWLVGGHSVVIGPANSAGDTLLNGYRVEMVAQTDQDIDSASVIINNVATGSGITLDQFADTNVGSVI